MNEKPIGVFDSGLGGLTVLSAIAEQLPHENLIYFGDTARVPYGSKSAETVVRYSLEILDFLLSKEVKTIVVACNTASSHALTALREKSPVPVIGVVEPGVQALLREAGTQEKAAVIATRSTVRSGSYSRTLYATDATLSLVERACPLLVPLVEEGMQDKKVTEMVLREYLDEIDREGIRYVILGCTHYPLLKPAIRRLYPHFELIDSSREIARTLEESLAVNQLSGNAGQQGKIDLYFSDITDNLPEMEKLFMGKSIDSIEKVSMGW